MTSRARSSTAVPPLPWPRTPTTAPPAISNSSTTNDSRTSTPDSAAAFTRRLSRTVRRGQNPPSPSSHQESSHGARMVRHRTSSAGRWAADQWRLVFRGVPTAPASRRRVATGCVWRCVSLGNVALSTSRTLKPPRARSMAVGEPAQRAPTTIASYIEVLRIETFLSNAGGEHIGRITQIAVVVKLGIPAYAFR